MDMATKEANEMLLRGKEALEMAGNMKRECKLTALDSLQSLYEMFMALALQMIKDQLNTLQRGFAQKICKAYRTVSLTSALVISSPLPLDLRIKEAFSVYQTRKQGTLDYLPPGREFENCVNHLDQPHPSKLVKLV
ncbi:unnamed protein product [Parnassius apollo]|uniref:(apollo) hypothetical protein n=1 Tax=Parnassius apollo TaxID=110799 RepID=A0A8S3XPI6_PARAO|nr:unnamed protein product [Parnassius apollo]